MNSLAARQSKPQFVRGPEGFKLTVMYLVSVNNNEVITLMQLKHIRDWNKKTYNTSTSLLNLYALSYKRVLSYNIVLNPSSVQYLLFLNGAFHH